MDGRALASGHARGSAPQRRRRRPPSTARQPRSQPARRLRIGLQDSCHLRNGMGVWREPRELLASIGEYVELPSAAACCGAAGSYSVVRPKDSARVLDPHLDEIAAADLDVIAVVNAGCYRQLEQGIKRRKLRTRVVHLAELLAAESDARSARSRQTAAPRSLPRWSRRRCTAASRRHRRSPAHHALTVGKSFPHEVVPRERGGEEERCTTQVLDPVSHSLGLTAIFAVLPLLSLFVLLGGLRMKAQWASLISLGVAVVVAIAVYGMPFGQTLDAGARGCGVWPLPDHVDRHQRVVDLPHDGEDRGLRRPAPGVQLGIQRPARPGGHHRLLLRCAARGARRLRHADRDLLGDAGGRRLQADEGGASWRWWPTPRPSRSAGSRSRSRRWPRSRDCPSTTSAR